MQSDQAASRYYKVGITLGGHQIDPDPATLDDLEAIGGGIAVGAKARIAVFGRLAPVRLELAHLRPFFLRWLNYEVIPGTITGGQVTKEADCIVRFEFKTSCVYET